MCPYSYKTILIEVFCCFLAYIRYIGCKFFKTTFGITNFKLVFINMNGCKVIFLNNFLIDYYGSLKVICFPGHESYTEVPAESQFPMFGSVAFREDLTFSYFFTFSDNRYKVDTGVLVCLPVFWKCITFDVIIKTDELFFISPGIPYNNFI